MLKIDVQINQLESSLASHSITLFQIKKRKNVTNFKKDFIAIRLGWYYIGNTLKFKNSLFSKDSLLFKGFL